MKAVWSFWSPPYAVERSSTWHRDWHHWLAWGLSLHTASRHYPDTCLVTDDEGARILIDELRLPFRQVSTALNEIRNEHPEWWALGKLKAYAVQEQPFVHIDTDVFLWKPLGRKLERADVLAQCPEPIVRGHSCYQPQELEQALGSPERGWLPREWKWYRQFDPVRAECCGIFGGRNLEFIRYYAETALRMVTHPRNRRSMQGFPSKVGQMILLEQYLLSACLEYQGVTIQYVFDDPGEAWRPEAAEIAGFTHLAGGAKRNPAISRYLEQRVRREMPDYYDHCMSYFR